MWQIRDGQDPANTGSSARQIAHPEAAIRGSCTIDFTISVIWEPLTDSAVLESWLMPNDSVPELNHVFMVTAKLAGAPQVFDLGWTDPVGRPAPC
jgi:uncharacterized protein YndB with AHSA1/START domain